jgi:hypothetical protein
MENKTDVCEKQEVINLEDDSDSCGSDNMCDEDNLIEDGKMDLNTPNKVTAKANLLLNVNSFKKWMKMQISAKGYEMPMFSGSHIGLTAINEALCRFILTHVLTETIKSKSGLYEVTDSELMQTVKMSNELNDFYYKHFRLYDSDISYSQTYCMQKKELLNYIENYVGRNINLTNPGYNVLAFLLVKASTTLLETAYQVMLSTRKKSLNVRYLTCAINIHFTGELNYLFTRKVEDAISSIKTIDDKLLNEEGGVKTEEIPNTFGISGIESGNVFPRSTELQNITQVDGETPVVEEPQVVEETLVVEEPQVVEETQTQVPEIKVKKSNRKQKNNVSIASS